MKIRHTRPAPKGWDIATLTGLDLEWAIYLNKQMARETVRKQSN